MSHEDSIAIFERAAGRSSPALRFFGEIDIGDLSSEDRAKSLEELSLLAERGDKVAMCAIVRALKRGALGVADVGRAFRWAQRAAEMDYPPGLYELGECLEFGVGTPRDSAAALEAYRNSARGGYTAAKVRLGVDHLEGDLAPAAPNKALELLEAAADAGDAFGAHELASCLENGKSGLPDVMAAERWYRRGSMLGNPFSSLRLAKAYARGELGLPKSTSLAREYEELAKRQ